MTTLASLTSPRSHHDGIPTPIRDIGSHNHHWASHSPTMTGYTSPRSHLGEGRGGRKSSHDDPRQWRVQLNQPRITPIQPKHWPQYVSTMTGYTSTSTAAHRSQCHHEMTQVIPRLGGFSSETSTIAQMHEYPYANAPTHKLHKHTNMRAHEHAHIQQREDISPNQYQRERERKRTVYKCIIY